MTGAPEETGRSRYFALQRLARKQGRDTQELLILYALEGLLRDSRPPTIASDS